MEIVVCSGVMPDLAGTRHCDRCRSHRDSGVGVRLAQVTLHLSELTLALLLVADASM
jgi:hypothetical protein